MNNSFIKYWVCSLAFLWIVNITGVQASDKDINLRLSQQGALDIRAREQSILQDEYAKEAATSQLTIDGKTYQVANNLSDLGQALYLTVKRKQWLAAATFMQRYLLLPGHDLMLVYYARGGLARQRGDLRAAEQAYQALLDLKTDFLPGQLELARTLFDNHKNKAANTLFTQIETAIPVTDAKTADVRQTIASFKQALAQRDDWLISINAGSTYTDNINQTNNQSSCLFYLPNTNSCFIKRSRPEKISARGIEFDASAHKRWSLQDHHGLFVRSFIYGNVYRNQPDYGETNAQLQAGYSYQSAQNQISLSPIFEMNFIGEDALYDARGFNADWLHTISAERLFKLEVSAKTLDYRSDLHSYEDGELYSANATLWQQLPQQWLFFGGLDYSEKNNQDKVSSHHSKGLRVGLSKKFIQGVETTLFASYRKREFKAYNAIYGVQRKDHEKSYTLTVSAPRFDVFGMTPNLTFKHKRVDSNADFFHSYSRNTVSLKLEKRF